MLSIFITYIMNRPSGNRLLFVSMNSCESFISNAKKDEKSKNHSSGNNFHTFIAHVVEKLLIKLLRKSNMYWMHANWTHICCLYCFISFYSWFTSTNNVFTHFAFGIHVYTFWHSFGFTYCVYAYKAWYMATFAVYTNLVIVAVPSTNSFFLLHSIKWTFLWRLGHRGRLWIFNVFFVTFQWNSFLCFLLSFFKRINNENKNNSSSWLTKAIHNAGGKEEKKHFCTCCMCAHLLFYGFSSWKQLFVLLFPILKRRCNLWRCMLTLSKNKEQKKLLNFRFEIMKAMLLLVFVVFHL